MEGGVVRRVRDDPSYRQRRGSIKSRIVQFSKKRKKEPPDKPARVAFDTNGPGEASDAVDRALPPHHHHHLPQLPSHRPPIKRRHDTRPPVLSLRDPVGTHNNNNNNGNSISHGNRNGASANNPTFPQFRIRTENNVVSHANGNGRVNGNGNGNGNSRVNGNGRVKHHEDLEIKTPVSSDHKPSEPVRLARPSDLYVNGPGSGAGDYSFMSSCSLPSGHSNSPSTPELVTLRQRQSVTNNYTESGRHLNSALARHFRRLQCGSEESSRGSQLSANLSSYLRDVFHQLDSGHTGSITRADFETLCEILELDSVPAPRAASATPGLHWLPSYQPRPGTPASPIRVDRINEAEFKSATNNKSSPAHQQAQHQHQHQQTSFLWTIGPRPFWELWPNKKHKKKRLSLEEFIQSLLEQWAKTHHYPIELASQASLEKDQGLTMSTTPDSKAVGDKSCAPCPSHAQSPDHTQFQRLRRSVVRLTRRCHREERLGRAQPPGHQHPMNGGDQGHGHQHPKMGGDQVQGHYNFPRHEAGLRSRLRGSLHLPVSGKKVARLERRLQEQQGEIRSLKECVTHLRDSLQLSDAQNLALQVMLRKVTKAESRLPHVEKSVFRSQMKKSEQQLENLVQELKEMSQTHYPSINSNNHSGSVFSFNGNPKNGDLGFEDELLSVHDSISGVKRELGSAQKQLHRISQQLDPALGDDIKTDLTMLEAYEALLKTEKEIENLRKSLLHEIKATKDVLMSSLKNVQDLELESRRVPQLEARIDDLEKLLPSERSGKISWAPESLLDDSFMVYTSSEECEEVASAQAQLPPRPPSSRSRDKSFISAPASPTDMLSPTPSSGHFSGASLVSKSPETQESLISRLRREIDGLRSRLTSGERGWASERRGLMSEISRLERGQSETGLEELRLERGRLALIEQRIREILAVLKSLNSMRISPRILGSMVISAVEAAYDEARAEVDVAQFLNLLFSETREYERQKAESILSEAMEAVTAESDESSGGSGTMSTIRPRGVTRGGPGSQEDSSIFRIDV